MIRAIFRYRGRRLADQYHIAEGRDGGPDGSVSRARWYVDGLLHRDPHWANDPPPPRPAFAERPADHACEEICPICWDAVWEPARTPYTGLIYCHSCIWEVSVQLGRDPVVAGQRLRPEDITVLVGGADPAVEADPAVAADPAVEADPAVAADPAVEADLAVEADPAVMESAANQVPEKESAAD